MNGKHADESLVGVQCFFRLIRLECEESTAAIQELRKTSTDPHAI